ncbi:hypothetical protein H9P43_002430 [Blastocladiella emersonii ATCC 22665]|nr:hypothetical protein H9P43_002430 [Blastocladiella emersonii ATCC 22665]
MSDDNHTIICVCGENVDLGSPMVQCEMCGCWQHVACTAYTMRQIEAMDIYLCDRCDQLSLPSPTASVASTAASVPTGIAIPGSLPGAHHPQPLAASSGTGAGTPTRGNGTATPLRGVPAAMAAAAAAAASPSPSPSAASSNGSLLAPTSDALAAAATSSPASSMNGIRGSSAQNHPALRGIVLKLRKASPSGTANGGATSPPLPELPLPTATADASRKETSAAPTRTTTGRKDSARSRAAARRSTSPPVSSNGGALSPILDIVGDSSAPPTPTAPSAPSAVKSVSSSTAATRGQSPVPEPTTARTRPTRRATTTTTTTTTSGRGGRGSAAAMRRVSSASTSSSGSSHDEDGFAGQSIKSIRKRIRKLKRVARHEFKHMQRFQACQRQILDRFGGGDSQDEAMMDVDDASREAVDAARSIAADLKSFLAVAGQFEERYRTLLRP